MIAPKIKYYLDFITDETGIIYINEPIGMDAVQFTLEQEEGRMGRDVKFAGGQTRFTFTRNRHDVAFDKIQEYFEVYGFESEIKLGIEIEDVKNIIGDFDFENCNNNQYDEFSCDVIQASAEALLKRRARLDVDLFSDKDVDGNDIQPVMTYDYLIKSKDILQESEWDMGSEVQIYETNDYIKNVECQIMPNLNIKKDSIDNTINGSFTNFKEKGETRPVGLNIDERGLITDYGYVVADSNLKDVTIEIDYDYVVNFTKSAAVLGTQEGVTLSVYHFKDILNGAYTSFDKVVLSGYNGVDTNIPVNLVGTDNLTINKVSRFDRICVIIEAVHTKPTGFLNNIKVGLQFAFSKMNLKISVKSTDYSRKIKAVRLLDAIKQVCKSTANLEVESDILENELYNQFIFDGNLIRGINDRPFYVTYEGLLNGLKETNIDYQVGEKVFFGRDTDFYANKECYVADGVRFDDYQKGFNPKFTINQIKYNYTKYQSNKENPLSNSYEIISGASNLTLRNKFVENTKNIEVNFVRDSFLIEETRRKSFRENSDSTQEDNTLFLLDSVPFSSALFTDNIRALHTVQDGKLALKNDDTFTWLDFGLEVGNSFVINIGSFNFGSYLVASVDENTLLLTPLATIPLAFNQPLVTSITYVPTGFEYQNRTNEGILTNNIFSPETFANLNYSNKRNIVKFYNSYLATCNIFRKEQPLVVSFYENNKDANTDIDGLNIIEGDDFTPSNPILNPYIHEVTLVIKSIKEYLELEESIRKDKGYIRLLDGKGNIVKIYPQRMEYSLRSKECNIVGEEKYFNKEINIAYLNTGFFTLNDEYTVTEFKYIEKRNKISIFDDSNKLLYPATFWQKVTVNGVFADSLEQLKEWLDSIS